MKVPTGKQIRCPGCKRLLVPGAEAEAFPFCTERCRLIDLGAWMEEAYTLGDGPPVSDPHRVPPHEA